MTEQDKATIPLLQLIAIIITAVTDDALVSRVAVTAMRYTQVFDGE